MGLKGQPFKKIGAVLKQMAPTVLAGMSGPAAPLVLGAERAIFGDHAADEGGLVGAIEEALNTPEGVVKIRELELASKKLEADTGVRFEELAVADRKDARALAEGRSLAPWLSLTCLFVGGYFGILLFVLYRVFYSQPDSMPDVALLTIASTLLGVLTGEIPRIMSWWFGSSQGSNAKTDVLAEAMRSK